MVMFGELWWVMFGDEFGVLMASSDEEIVEFGSTEGKKGGTNNNIWASVKEIP